MVILKPRLNLVSPSPFSISLQRKHGKPSISYNGQEDWNKQQDMILSNNTIISFWGSVIYVWLWRSVCFQPSAAKFLQGTVTSVYLMQEQTCLPNSEMKNKMFLRRIAENCSSYSIWTSAFSTHMV